MFIHQAALFEKKIETHQTLEPIVQELLPDLINVPAS